MGRLLDMEEIIKFAKTTYPTEDVKKITWLLCHTPTAYNVEKVVEQLREQDGTCTGCNRRPDECAWCSVKDRLDIVRKGGVE